jgi:outer membrane receptor protein involved in Fe transport
VSRLNLSSNFTYYLDDPVRGDQFEQAERRQTYGAHTARNWSADWGGLEMTNKVGAQVRHDRLAPVGLHRAEGGTQWWPWFGQFQLRYFGPRPLIEDNSQRSKGTTLAYLRAGYRINAHTRLSLDIFNLFNRKASDIDYHYVSRLPGEPADGVGGIHSHPAEPRTARLTLTVNF